MKNTQLKLVALLFGLMLFSCHKPSLEEPSKKLQLLKASQANKKVLLIGIDGLQYDKIGEIETPNFDTFSFTKAYTGGVVGTPSEQGTKSGPGWMTILTGVWGDKHGVPNNSSGTYESQAKSIFQYLKEGNSSIKTSSIATWAPIHEFLQNQMSYIDTRSQGGNDSDATTSALNEINNSNPEFLFVHFDNIDIVGHSSGFTTNYYKAIKEMDERLGLLKNAIDKRSKDKNEDWLIILTTDHGRKGQGYSHGGQSEQEKTIFIGMNKTGNDEFTSTVSQIPNNSLNNLYSYPAQTSIVPTILTYLNVDITPSSKLSSTSLIGDLGPRKVMINPINNNLYWYSISSNNAEIYKNDQLIATVPAAQGYYNDVDTSQGVLNYTVLIDGQIGSVIRKNYKITAGLDWNDITNNTAYFFRTDDKYVKYNKLSDESYYTSPINNSTWAGLDSYKEKINAAFKWNNNKGYFFLNDGTYIRYDMNNDSVDPGFPKAINNTTWPGLYGLGNKIIAAFQWNNTKAYLFLNDGRYIRYDMNNDSVDPGYPKEINNTTWPGLGNYSTKITAAIDWNSQYFYIFLKDNTYLKYDKQSDSVITGYPKPINSSTWPGLLK